MRNLGEQVAAQVHDLFEEELALIVDFRAFFCGCSQLNEGIIDTTVVESLKKEAHIVVQQILIKVDYI